MKIRLFVASSAVIFTAWLGITFFREVPREHYPQVGRPTNPISAKADSRAAKPMVSNEKQKSEEPIAIVE